MMKERLQWALSITALVVAVFGVTPLGSATVKKGMAAAKAPLYASGALTRGPRGPRGPRGLRGRPGPLGPQGAQGDQGPQGLQGTAIVARARAAGAVATASYPGSDDPLSGNTWVQGSTEDDVVLGSITFELPAQCSTFSMSFFRVDMYLDGTATASFQTFAGQGSSTSTFEIPLEVAPGAQTQHTLTAKVVDTCNTGAHFAVTDLKLDIAGLA
jgi:Collagen triple helix repeat (20 copies)